MAYLDKTVVRVNKAKESVNERKRHQRSNDEKTELNEKTSFENIQTFVHLKTAKILMPHQ